MVIKNMYLSHVRCENAAVSLTDELPCNENSRSRIKLYFANRSRMPSLRSNSSFGARNASVGAFV